MRADVSSSHSFFSSTRSHRLRRVFCRVKELILDLILVRNPSFPSSFHIGFSAFMANVNEDITTAILERVMGLRTKAAVLEDLQHLCPDRAFDENASAKDLRVLLLRLALARAAQLASGPEAAAMAAAAAADGHLPRAGNPQPAPQPAPQALQPAPQQQPGAKEFKAPPATESRRRRGSYCSGCGRDDVTHSPSTCWVKHPEQRPGASSSGGSSKSKQFRKNKKDKRKRRKAEASDSGSSSG